MTDVRAPRADARRNRALVLEAAEVAFAADGLAVPIDEIARRAGVGVGTVYRHFPNKEALFEAIVLGRIERVVAEAGAWAEADDPGDAFFRFLDRLVQEGGAKRDLVDALGGAGIDLKGTPVMERLALTMGELLVRAQGAGAVRDDVGVADLTALLAGVGAIADPERRRRAAAVVRDGLRPRR